MRQVISAKFDTYDSAEAAAMAVKHSIKDTEVVFVRPEIPGSLSLTRKGQKHFTLIPTAVTSMNYYTILSENDYNYKKVNEFEKRQTSDIRLICDADSAQKAAAILIAKGGIIT